jgi:hypothetical protein
MDDKNVNNISEKIMLGMRKALKKLVETNAANNKDLVIKGKDGKAQRVPAKELLHRLD